ncbi:hypothetical protein D3C78_700400 [compost metagenome]
MKPSLALGFLHLDARPGPRYSHPFQGKDQMRILIGAVVLSVLTGCNSMNDQWRCRSCDGLLTSVR